VKAMKRPALRLLFVAAILVATSSFAAAHTLLTNTAKITLRDGHLDIAADLDLFAIAASSPTELATATEQQMVEQVRQMQRVLESESSMWVDEVRVPLVLRGFPSASELRALAAELSAAGHDRGKLARVVFESSTAAHDATLVSLRLPRALGTTLVSFVQPLAVLARPATIASFAVYVPRSSGEAARAAAWLPALGGALAALVILALAAGLVSQARRHRRTKSNAKVVVMAIVTMFVGGCQPDGRTTPAGTAGRFAADVWADNWFAMYINDDLVAEDAFSVTTEKSFNSESFSFDANYPYVINLVIKDYKQNDTGLEYIGTPAQQIGDGGFIMQVVDTQTGALVAVSNSAVRCLVIHKAPLNVSCEKSSDPSTACLSRIDTEPAGWRTQAEVSASWSAAQIYTAAQIGTKGGYDDVTWDIAAKLIWTSDLKTDNTLLCKLTIEGPS
jgi:hypothetical protein